MGVGTSGARRSILTTVLTFVVATVAMAAGASVPSHPPTRATPAPVFTSGDADTSKEEAAAYGGPIERAHDAATCDLADVTALPTNWTHGDYVRAVARSGKDRAVREAARSVCGKPVWASTHAGQPGEGHGRGDVGAGRSSDDQGVDAAANASSHAQNAGAPDDGVPAADAAAAAHG